MNIPDELSPLLFPVADLHELPGNPRRGDVEAVRRSYEAFGQRKPIVARKDADGRCVVVAGNHQLKAARELGWEQIAVVWADDLTDDEARAFALADNRVADLGGYDDADLLALLESVDDLGPTGYTDLDVADLAALVNYDPMGSIDDLLGEVGDLDGSEGNVSLRLDLTAPVLDQWKDHRKGFDTDDEALAYLMDK